jgi:hypothetical protein
MRFTHIICGWFLTVALVLGVTGVGESTPPPFYPVDSGAIEVQPFHTVTAVADCRDVHYNAVNGGFRVGDGLTVVAINQGVYTTFDFQRYTVTVKAGPSGGKFIAFAICYPNGSLPSTAPPQP